MNDYIEVELLEMGMGNVMRMRLACELLSSFRSSIHYPDLGVALSEPEDRRPSRTSGSDYEDLGSREDEPLFQWADDSRNIGVESVEFSVVRAN